MPIYDKKRKRRSRWALINRYNREIIGEYESNRL